MKRSIDGLTQQRLDSAPERESSSGTTDVSAASSTSTFVDFSIQFPSKSASLPVQIAFFPLNLSIATALWIVQLNLFLVNRAWHTARIRLGLERHLNPPFITSSRRPGFLDSESSLGKLNAYIQRFLSLQIERRLLPLLSHLITFVHSVVPAILDIKVLQFCIPFAIWRFLLLNFGSAEQRISIGALQDGDDAQKVSAQTDSLRAQKVQLEKENGILKLKVKDFEAGLHKMNADLARSAEELKNNRAAVKENENLHLKMKDLEEGWRKASSELKTTKESVVQELDRLHAEHAQQLAQLETSMREEYSVPAAAATELRDEVIRLQTEKTMLERESGILRQQLNEALQRESQLSDVESADAGREEVVRSDGGGQQQAGDGVNKKKKKRGGRKGDATVHPEDIEKIQ
ncbi:hypothetical protein BV898_00254 [Hypsibius exemplaris]|uniref:Uncharacterized protein n=1 Tax=Hypsibius exemplaris TaxID=2072580 RepID=A0A1W0XF78_HYPEX|nr:hypothetical protein BV898_00254 [Hypsibius exemplaris]